MIKVMVIGLHFCPIMGTPEYQLRTKVAQAAINVERVIIERATTKSGCEAHESHPPCYRHGVYRHCPILKGQGKCRTATVHGVGRQEGQYEDLRLGPLQMIEPLLDHLDQLTMIIPPTACIFMPETTDFARLIPEQTRILRLATRHIKNIRIIIGTDSPTSLTHESTESLARRSINFLAQLIAPHTATFDVFVFGHDHIDPFDAAQFRQELLAGIERLRPHSVESDAAAETVIKGGDLTASQARVSIVGGIRKYHLAHRPAQPEMSPFWCDYFGALFEDCLASDAGL